MRMKLFTGSRQWDFSCAYNFEEFIIGKIVNVIHTTSSGVYRALFYCNESGKLQITELCKSTAMAVVEFYVFNSKAVTSLWIEKMLLELFSSSNSMKLQNCTGHLNGNNLLHLCILSAYIFSMVVTIIEASN